MLMDYGWKTIIGKVPSKSNSYRVASRDGHGTIVKSDRIRDYERSFYMQVGSLRNLEIDSLYEFYVRVYYPTMSSDLDNALKVLEDCLQHTKTLKNDNRCVKIVAEKFIDKVNPRVEFRIVTIDD